MKKSFILCFIALLTSCAGSASIQSKALNKVDKPINQYHATVDENYKKALQMFTSSIAEVIHDDKNQVYSPISIFNCYAMLYEGSQGESKRQMEEVMNLSSKFTLKEAVQESLQATSLQTKHTTLDVSSSLWVDDGFKNSIKEDYLATLSDYYYAEVYQGDFKKTTLHADVAKWINQKTNNFLKIEAKGFEDLENSVMLLLNSIYLKDSWITSFEEFNNEKGMFRCASSVEKEVTFMNQTTNGFVYETEEYAIASLPLHDGISMNILLPKTTHGETVFKNKKAIDDLVNFQSLQKQNYRVHYQIPQFKCNEKYSLTSILKSLGMKDIFDCTLADLSGISTSDLLYVSQSVHEAGIDVNNDGIEAAAYTSIVIAPESTEQPEELMDYDFIVDHNFMYCITENNQLPLFMGVYNEVE